MMGDFPSLNETHREFPIPGAIKRHKNGPGGLGENGPFLAHLRLIYVNPKKSSSSNYYY